jgi:hypothetical protein
MATNQDFILKSGLQINGPTVSTGPITAPTVIASLTGNATSASALATARTLSYTGDATGTNTFNGSADVATVLTLANSGVTAGTYSKVTVDAKGRVTTATSLGLSDITTALGFTPINAALLGANNGVATLDATGKLTTNQMPASLVGAVVYQTVWNASTNTPVLSSGVGTKGNYYKVSVSGSTLIDGISQWNIGDTIIFDGSTWGKIDGIASEVTSVFGRVGTVIMTSADVVTALGFTPLNSVSPVVASGTLTLGSVALVSSNSTFISGALQIVDSFAIASFRSAKYEALVIDTTNSKFHVVEFIVLHDGTNVYKTEYGQVTSVASLGSFDATISAGSVNVTFTPSVSSNYTVRLNKSVMAV